MSFLALLVVLIYSLTKVDEAFLIFCTLSACFLSKTAYFVKYLFIEHSRQKPSRQDYWSECTVGVKQAFPACHHSSAACVLCVVLSCVSLSYTSRKHVNLYSC